MSAMRDRLRRLWRLWQGRKLKRCVAQITSAAKESLVDAGWVELVLCRAGLKYLPPPHGAHYGADRRWMNFHADGLFQIPRQLARMMVLVAEQRPASLIEIGTNNGWTACVLTAYLRRFVPSFRAVTLDVKDYFTLRRWATTALPLEFCPGRTSDDFKGQRFDFCFVDGSHSLEWVTRDFENVGCQARVCAFHDINDAATEQLEGGGSLKHWRWLKASWGAAGTFHEILDHSESERVMGIGVFVQTSASHDRSTSDAGVLGAS